MESPIKAILNERVNLDKHLIVLRSIFKKRVFHNMLVCLNHIKSTKKCGQRTFAKGPLNMQTSAKLHSKRSVKQKKQLFVYFLKLRESAKKKILHRDCFEALFSRWQIKMRVCFGFWKSLAIAHGQIFSLKQTKLRSLCVLKESRQKECNSAAISTLRFVCYFNGLFAKHESRHRRHGFDTIFAKGFEFEIPAKHDLEAYHKILLEEKVL